MPLPAAIWLLWNMDLSVTRCEVCRGGGCQIVAINIYNNITKLENKHQKSIVLDVWGRFLQDGEFKGLGDYLEKGIPKFAAEGCTVSPVERRFPSLVLSYIITCVIYRALDTLNLPHESMYCSANSFITITIVTTL